MVVDAVLLVSVGLSPWVELLFPAWVLLPSVDILWRGLTARSGTTDAGASPGRGAALHALVHPER